MPIKEKGGITGMKAWRDGFKMVEENMIKGRRRGIIKWGLLVKKESMRNVPVRLGNLRASAFFVVSDGEKSPGRAFKGDDASEMQGQHASVLSEAKAEAASRTNKNQIVGVVGHSAEYAAITHELETAGAAGYDSIRDAAIITSGPRKGKRRRAEEVHSKVGGWKFLWYAINAMNSRGLQIMAKELKIG